MIRAHKPIACCDRAGVPSCHPNDKTLTRHGPMREKKARSNGKHDLRVRHPFFRILMSFMTTPQHKGSSSLFQNFDVFHDYSTAY